MRAGYIDPMFHSRIIGAKSANLDLHFFSENTLRYLLAKNAADRDISIIEGVMGYYDGLGLTSTKASSYEVAQVTDSPVVLVVNAKGASLSVLAVIQGFLNFAPKSNIRGVLLNQCSPMAYTALSRAIEERLGVACYGYLPKNGKLLPGKQAFGSGHGRRSDGFEGKNVRFGCTGGKNHKFGRSAGPEQDGAGFGVQPHRTAPAGARSALPWHGTGPSAFTMRILWKPSGKWAGRSSNSVP